MVLSPDSELSSSGGEAQQSDTSNSTDLSLSLTDNETFEQSTMEESGLSSDQSGSTHAPSVINLTHDEDRRKPSMSTEEPVRYNGQIKNEDILALLQPPPRERIIVETAKVSSGEEALQEDAGGEEFDKTKKYDKWDQGCRICHDIGSGDLFISPCDCKGSLSLVHKHCLERWLAESNSSACELCGYEYNTLRLPKYNWVVSIYAFLSASSNVRERRMLLWDIFSLSVAIPLAAWGTGLGMKILAQEMPPSMTGFILTYTRLLQLFMMTFTVSLDAGVMTWSLIRLQYHLTKWYEWYTRNCRVILLGYPESGTVPEVSQTPSPTARGVEF